MQGFLQKYMTTEATLVGGGVLWAILSQFLPGLSALDVPQIVPALPAFQLTPGHMIVLGLIPVALKIVTPGKVPFIGAVNQKPLPDGAPPPPTGDDK